MLVGIYVRVSTAEQAKEGYSIGEQIERLKTYCKAMGWTVYKTYTDAGFSGGSMDRPGLQKLISDVGKIQKVVVYKLDRLSRSQLDTLYLIEKVFLANNVDFVSMTENFSANTPFGKATLGLLAVFAELEKSQIRERMMMGKDAKINEGKWIGSIVPMGYDYDKETKLLKINVPESLQIKEAFVLFNDGVPLNNIVTRFIEKGYTLKNGNPWSLYTLRYILENRVYSGFLRSGNNWVPGIHEPIITDETWQKAHEKMETNKERYFALGVPSGGKIHTTYLGGLIYCGQCCARYGKRLSGNPNGRHYTYCCYSRMKVQKRMIKDPACKNKIYRVEELDRIVFDEIRKLKTEPLPEVVALQDNAAVIARAEIDKIDAQISRLLDLYSLGRFSAQALDKKVTDLEVKKSTLQKDLSAPQKLPRSEAVQLISTFDEVLARGDFTEIRYLLESLIDRITIDGESVKIQWAFF